MPFERATFANHLAHPAHHSIPMRLYSDDVVERAVNLSFDASTELKLRAISHYAL